jgi:hypothetical protein
VTWNLRIGRRWPGETADEIAERLGRDEQEEAAPDPAEIRRMGNLLGTAAPGLVKSDAPKGWTLTHSGSGAQIRMSGDEFSMTVPRAFSPSMARSVWTDLWPVIRVLADEDYFVYAPPLRRLIDPAADLDAVVTEYSGTPAASTAPPEPPKRRWKFW